MKELARMLLVMIAALDREGGEAKPPIERHPSREAEAADLAERVVALFRP